VGCPEAYVKLTYESGYVDSNPTVEITRDGTNYETVVLDRIGATGIFYGKHIFTGTDANPLELRLKITSTETNKYLKGIGIFHNRIPIGTASAKTIEYHYIDSDQHDVTISLGNILTPDKDLLKVEIPETGQVFREDTTTFSIEGRDLVFNTDFFYDPPLRQIKVIVNQAEGSVFDSSDANGSLLHDNHLGSTNSNVDLSKNGRGIILMSPNGTLYEITVQDGGTGIDIYEVV